MSLPACLSIPSLNDLPDITIHGKRVLVRTDFNVPLGPDGSVVSDHRIRASLPTLTWLVERQARVIIATHLGRPKGIHDPQYSLKPVAEALCRLMPGVTIHLAPAVVGPAVTQAVLAMAPGDIMFLENMRFEPGETSNDPVFIQQLAELADIYVNDAFGAAHRAHASTEGVAHVIPVKAAGLLMARELAVMGNLLGTPRHPFVAIIGGSKVSSKIGVLSHMLPHVDTLILGGGMVFTFLKAQGYPVGTSLVEEDYLETALDLLEQAQHLEKSLLLPTDLVIADRFSADAYHQVVPAHAIPDGWMGLDLGPASVANLNQVLESAQTVLWNGPLGVFEFPAFSEATRHVAQTLARLTKKGQLTSVLGGGDTQAALEQFEILPAAYTHVSTGGGASLEFLEGRQLPGVMALASL
jgi:phosphoglycerate kinase